MANKTTANWSQRVEGPRPVAVVYTRKNTPLEEWKKMVVEELIKLSADNLVLHPLAALHAWEFDATPASYAYTLWNRATRAEDRRRNPMG
jgi:hypothetical protein